MRSKYHNKKTIIGDIVFDSKKESLYYLYLKELENQGKISNLELQVEYVLTDKCRVQGKAIRETKYCADFRYKDIEGNIHVIDVKASKYFQDPVFKLKKKLFAIKFGILIEEVYDVPKN